MSAISPLSHDKLNTIQSPEKTVVRKYRKLCSAIVELAENPQETGSTRVAAHRVIHEYIIKPLKEQYLAERKARAESKASTPHAVNIAVSNLPVGAAASVQIVNAGQNPQMQHIVPSRKESITRLTDAKPLITQDDSPMAGLRVGGEAAEKAGVALTNVVHPPHFLDIPNDCATKGIGTEHKPECHDTSATGDRPSISPSEYRKLGLMTYEEWQAEASSSQTSSGTRSSSISGELGRRSDVPAKLSVHHGDTG